ncbi:ribosome associated membrane protein RAMP4-domain-containing protein [Piptocephalis cylindrospora]|uniref:Stress-associated endoplasmic reticulum protein n=1 Tax=Piptocephalis cylindrospora TaxID=1907219 RepID=A0A4P9Y8M3_9FUNG|nr:ribosome associated membrane protein RAMP4-domain-containing protein [Piptocephalis cylindrospora]|eukprot:RKP15453.1 ribosome associated membrane protein RAMP4-domain-containing protein [Piptocephalis cylindrospora]
MLPTLPSTLFLQLLGHPHFAFPLFPFPPSTMPSTPTIKNRNAAHARNIHHRGNVKETLRTKKTTYPVSGVTLAILVFVVIGGAVFELLRWIV